MLKRDLDKMSAMRYVVDDLDIRSGATRVRLLSAMFSTDRVWLNDQFDAIQKALGLLNEPLVERIKIKLSQVKDIAVTIQRVDQGVVLDDVELFELKHLAALSEETFDLCRESGLVITEMPSLCAVFELLDPDKQGVTTFYVYDSYSEELRALRAEIRQHPELADQLYVRVADEELAIRAELCRQLKPHVSQLSATLAAITHIDLTLAKADQAARWGMSRGQFAQNTSYQGLFNPQVRESLRAHSREFQSVDIEMDNAPIIITGANMAGKSVLLKSVALAQLMFQYGFFVPAARAEIKPVEGVELSIGDDEDQLRGLSSYAAEMLRVSRIVAEVKRGRKLLVLIDELARTTNPVEGRALVSAVVGILADHHCTSLVTTHYSDLSVQCKRLRIKGFVGSAAQRGAINKNNIGDYIDYSPIADDSNSAPQEAINIADILGVDAEITDRARELMKQK